MKYVWSNRCRIANVVICSLLCCCNDTKYFLKLYDVYWILRFQACNAIAKAITIENNEKAESRIEIFQHQHQDCNGCLLFTVCAHKLCFIPVCFFSLLFCGNSLFFFFNHDSCHGKSNQKWNESERNKKSRTTNANRTTDQTKKEKKTKNGKRIAQ